MKPAKDPQFNDNVSPAGNNIPWYFIYPFFLVHMLAFGTIGFISVYAAGTPDLWLIYGFNGFALFIYTIFYLVFFGLDQIKWMFINAALGIFGIYTQLGWLLSLFGKHISNYPLHLQIVPCIYFVFYTFLLRHAVLDIFHAHSPQKRKHVEYGYIAASLAISIGSYALSHIQ